MKEIYRALAGIGMGGLKVSLCEVQSIYSRGDAIRGHVLIESGRVAQHLREIRVELRYQNALMQYRFDPSTTAACNPIMEAGSIVCCPFELRVPDYADVGGGIGLIWRLRAVAMPRHALVMPSTEIPVTIVPHSEALGIQSGLRFLGFGQARSSNAFIRAGDAAGASVETVHDAPFGLRDQIISVSLHVAVFEQHIVGWLGFLRRPHSVSDGAEVLPRRPLDRFHFQLPRRDLANALGDPQPEGAIPTLRSILRAAVVLPENVDEKTLLRAADAIEASELLRPAANAHDTDTSKLLRATPPSDSS